MLLILFLLAFFLSANVHAAERPNIVIVMVDDMGWSDIGCYGSEIETPHLDQLAAHGLRFSQFYNTGRCCPTRASLLTGLYSHQAGIGHMNEDQGAEFPGFRGALNRDCMTIGEVLKGAGYRTLMAGKWHVGASKQEWWPRQRGFDRFFGVPAGGGFYFQPKPGRDLVLDDEILIPGGGDVPAGWYVTDAFTDYSIEFIEEAVSKQQPFFLYLAHIAPHWPLQAPQEDIDRYLERYQRGWGMLRNARHRRQQEMGLVRSEWPISPIDRGNKQWGQVENKPKQVAGMAVYAAVINRMDQSIGRLTSSLQQQGVLDNTLFLFLSDNGGCAEGGQHVTNRSEAELGANGSDVRYGRSWANVSNTPFREYKHWVHEGGIATPLIVHWPQGVAEKLNGTITHQPGHVIDLMATCVDVAEADYPASFSGRDILPYEGKSLAPIFSGETREQPPLFWEHEGNRAVRDGKWKLVAKGRKGTWELYDLDQDRTELHDLAAEEPARVMAMAQLWNDWAKRARVYPNPHGEFGPTESEKSGTN